MRTSGTQEKIHAVPLTAPDTTSARQDGTRAGHSLNSAVFVDKARGLRPFYFIVVVWGSTYTDLLLNFCITSLLAPGNIPALLNRGKNKFLVVTTLDDWERMNRSPILEVLKKYLEIVHLVIPSQSPEASIYDHMGVGHKMATQRAFQDKAYGVLLTPDMMMSDGSLASIQKHAVAGVQVVLTAALRYGEEPLFGHLENMGLVSIRSRLGDEASALSITGRQMASAGVNSFHNETLRFEWDAPYFAPYYTGLPAALWWQVPEENGVIIHSSSWAAVLVDYAALDGHDSSTMDHWAIDGDYIYRNFGDSEHIFVSQDSDEIMLVSWTSMDMLTLSRKHKWLLTLPRLGEFIKGCLLRDAFLGPTSDPLKRRILHLPVYFHANEINGAWRCVELRAQAILTSYLTSEQGIFRIWSMRWIGVAHRIYVLLLGRWDNRRHIMEMACKALHGDTKARDYLRHRIRLYFRQLIGRTVGGK